MNDKFPYSCEYNPPAPVLEIRLAAPGENPNSASLFAIIDTGSDGTLIPNHYLESVEAIAIGEAMLYGLMGESQKASLYEVDILIGEVSLPGIIVACNERGDEVVLGRNVINRLILILNGLQRETEVFTYGPSASRSRRFL